MPFTWSWSRHRSLETCHRRYFYDYYGSRHGWRRPVGDRARELYALKRLVGRSQWVGQRVHDIAAGVIGRWREGRDVVREELLADTARQTRRQIDDARRGLAALDPRKRTNFLVLFYEDDPGDAWWEDLVDEMCGQVEAWLDHPLAQRLHEVPERIREVEKLERLVVGEVPVWVSLDVLVEDGQGGFVVIDWKTGRHHVDEVVDGQLGVYGLYVHRRYGAPVDRVVGVHASTRFGDFRQHAIDAEGLRLTHELVHASAARMAALLADPGKDEADEDRFARLPEGDPQCATCRYRRACGRE